MELLLGEDKVKGLANEAHGEDHEGEEDGDLVHRLDDVEEGKAQHLDDGEEVNAAQADVATRSKNKK